MGVCEVKSNRILILFFGFIFSSCINNSEEVNHHNLKSFSFNKREFFLNKMKEKNFELEKNGPCDDALIDVIDLRDSTYVESLHLNDTIGIVEFKFIESCCKEFLGDYSIKNDTLKFKLVQVNDIVCSCLCWFRYKLTIRESNDKIKGVVFVKSEN